jgi:hypothetical protein
MSEKDTLQGLNCPNCAGMVPIPEGQTMVKCPYCEMRSLVRGERGLSRYQVPLRVERKQAKTALHQFLSDKLAIARNVTAKSRLQETFIAYLPFWASWADVLGWVFGQEEVGSGDDKHYEPREVKIAQEMTWTGAACDVGEFGVEEVALKKRPLEPFNPDTLHANGLVFEPIGSSSEAKNSAEDDFKARVRGMANLDRVAQTFVRFAKNRMGLVYYPLWVMRYIYRGRSFQVVVDGYTNKVLYGKAPGSTLYRAVVLVGGMALGALLAVDGTALAGYLGFELGDEDSFLFFLGAAGVALAGGISLMGLAYRAFRYGEQYEFRSGEVKKRSFRRTREGGVRRVREVDA